MKRIRLISLVVITTFILMDSCSEEFLEVTPNETLNEAMLATYEGVDQVLIGAYALLDGASTAYWVNHPGYGGRTLNQWSSSTSGWCFSSVRGQEANKGSVPGDQEQFTWIHNFIEEPGEVILEEKWLLTYEGVTCCNAAILTARTAERRGTITSDQASHFIRQARALRGFYHLEAWRMWADRSTGMFIPYIDEHTDTRYITNTEDVRLSIIEDLMEGTKLPNDMKQVGRFNRTVSQVLLAKAYMQMYNDYASALPLLADIEANGTNPAGQQADLEPCYGDIFDLENRNGIESIYTVQYSVNDYSLSLEDWWYEGFNGGRGEMMNFPMGGPAGCCGFFQPTQDFVNAFRTDASGLPYLETYNDEKVTSDQGLDSGDPFTEYAGRLDPRLDWSVGRRGIPYWDWGEHPGKDWIRAQSDYGPYSPKKQVYKKSQEGIYTQIGYWTSGYTANGFRLIRYADVLLLKAECEAMTGSDDLGLGEVNAVRARAANPDGFVKEADGVTNAANYVIDLYPAFANQEEAMKAIKFERRLELGLEGHRYWDLQRWGEVQTELSRIRDYERTMEWGEFLYTTPEGIYLTVGPEDVNYPVPIYQIEIHPGRIVQNR